MNIAYELGWLFILILLIVSIYYASFHIKQILRFMAVALLAISIWVILRLGVLIMEATWDVDWNTSAFSRIWELLENTMRDYYKHKTGMDL